MPGEDPFAALGLPPTASPEQVKAAYRAAARRLHPDVGGDEESFKELTRMAHAALDIADGSRPNPYLPRVGQSDPGNTDHIVRVEQYDRHAHSPPPPPNVWSNGFLGGALFWILPVCGAILMLSAAAGENFLPVYAVSMGVFAVVLVAVLRRR